MAKTGEYKIPFDSNGNLLHYQYGVCQLVDNYQFGTTLVLRDMAVGRSAKYLIWEDTAGRQYPMFVSCLLNAIKAGAVIKEGRMTGSFTFRKRGQNYGIRWITN